MMRSSGWRSRSQASACVRVGVDHEDRVARADLGLRVAAERAGEAVAHRAPVVRGSGEKSETLLAPGRRRVAVDRDARAVGPAVAHLGEHRAEVLAELLADRRRLAEKPDDSAHGSDFSVAFDHS